MSAKTTKRDEGSRIPPLIRRNTIYFALTQALQQAEGQLSITFGAIMVTRLLGSASLAGIGGSLLSLSRFLVAYPTGKLTDAYGRRAGMVIGLILGIIGGIMLGGSLVVSSFPLFLVGIVFLGLGWGAGQQLRVAAVDMYPPARRAEGLGYVLSGSVAGAFVAPVIIAIAEALGRRTGSDPVSLSWFLMPAVLLPAIALTLMVRPDPKAIAANLERFWPSYEPPAPTEASQLKVRGDLRTFIRDKPKQVAYIAYATAQGTMTMMMTMTPLVMSHEGHDLAAISLAVSIHVVGMYLFSVFLGRLADRIGRKPLLWGGMAAQAIGAFMVPISPLYWIATLGLFLVGVGWSAINVSATTIIADTSEPEERGRAIGANDAFAGAWGILTPLAGGFVAAAAGMTAVGIAGMVMALLPLLILGRLREVRPGHYE
ncbi:MAG: MFS transporter [Dehalococcoidia bacterium]|nr:MFS transporter [Dehalococcoidia bacterium]